MPGLTSGQVYRRLRWKVPAQKVGGGVRFRREDVERWIEDSKA
jgi:excisionase family DNA binding protein